MTTAEISTFGGPEHQMDKKCGPLPFQALRTTALSGACARSCGLHVALHSHKVSPRHMCLSRPLLWSKTIARHHHTDPSFVAVCSRLNLVFDAMISRVILESTIVSGKWCKNSPGTVSPGREAPYGAAQGTVKWCGRTILAQLPGEDCASLHDHSGGCCSEN